jgi:TPR repeat protein
MWFALLAWLCLCAGPARADFQKAASAFEAGNFEAAADELSQEAAAGDPRAQALLGRILLDIPNIRNDFSKGFSLMTSAADAGDPEAEFTLGTIYALGLRGHTDFVEKNQPRALRYFNLAASQGLAEAHYFVAGLSSDVDGGKSLSRIAVDELTKALDGGFLMARGAIIDHEVASNSALTDRQKLDLLWQYQSDGDAYELYLLGTFYEKGTGTAANPVEALKWYYLADDLRDDAARAAVDRLGAKLSKPERQVARESADLWLMDKAHSKTGYYPVAACWCVESGPGSLQCLKRAVSNHLTCRQPYFPPFFANYYRSKAYDICRRFLLDHPN